MHQVFFRRIGFVPAYATLRVEAADSVDVRGFGRGWAPGYLCGFRFLFPVPCYLRTPE